MIFLQLMRWASLGVDTMYSKAYLRHLFAAKEMLGKQIASIHNLGFYVWLTREARKHIISRRF